MKRIILSALLLGSAAVTANAQANSVLVFGNLGIGASKDATEIKHFNFNINPGIGYQMDDHWTLGVEGGFGTTRSKADGATAWKYDNNYQIGAFGRFTQTLDHKNIFAFYAQLGIGYEGMTSSSPVPGGESIIKNGVYAYLVPAIAINVYRGFALNFNFGGLDFSRNKFKGAENASTGLDLQFGKQISIGISKNFMCGKKRHHVGTNHGSHEHHDADHDNEESED